MTPPAGGQKARQRIRELLQKHNERVKIASNADVNQPEEYELQNIRYHLSTVLQPLVIRFSGASRVHITALSLPAHLLPPVVALWKHAESAGKPLQLSKLKYYGWFVRDICKAIF